MEPLIEVRGLRYKYHDGTVALRGVDFALGADETVALLGPNGAGKTTFVLHLVGLMHGEGDVTVCGMPVREENLPAVRRKVGILFQDPDEQMFMPTVLEDVTFGPLNLGLTEEEALVRGKRALEEVGMAAALDKAPYHLSAGEKRRVALAGVLAMEPEILVLDEPTTYLDPPGQRELIKLLRGLPQAKILVTHNGVLARALATRAVFFEGGLIAGEGTAAEMIGRFDWDVQTERVRGAGGE